MATQYLSKTGLTYLWGRIVALYQPKEAGKGLSTNDLTDALVTEINKISTIETQVNNLVNEGGEPNVIESVKVNGTALAVTDKAVDVTVPTKVSDLTNDGDGTSGSAFATESYVTTNGGKIDKIKVNGTEQTIAAADKSVDITVPTAVSALTNDSGYLVASDISGKANAADVYTKAEVDSAIADAVGDITSFELESVDALPASGEKGVVYLVPNGGNAPNVKDEYIWVTNAFEKIGTTEINLSNYLQSSDIEAITTAEIDEITGA